MSSIWLSFPTLDDVVTFLNTTDGRDRVTRCLQYGCLAWTPSAPIHKLYNALSMARKILRMSKSLDLWNHISDPCSDKLDDFSRRTLLGFFIIDHFVWAYRIGFLQFSDNAKSTLNILKSSLWIAVLLSTILRTIRRMKSAYNDQDEGGQNSSHLRHVLVRNILDVPICLHFAGIITMPTRGVGSLGLISSLMALMHTDMKSDTIL